jgi:hypothetical protein
MTLARAATGLLLAGLLALALPAAAQPGPQSDEEAERRAQEIGLDVTVGYRGSVVGHRWLPVEVALQPSRLVAGTLRVETRAGSGRAVEIVEVEVAAGSRKVYRLLLPAGPVSVQLAEPDREPTTARSRAPRRPDGWAAGILGPLPDGLPPLRHEPTGATGTWVGLDPAWPELGAEALEPLSALVADRAALAALSEHGRRNVAAAVASGLDLVVVAGVDGAPALGDIGLPWDPATAVTTDGGARTVTAAEGAWTMPQPEAAGEQVDARPIAAAVPAGRGRVTVSVLGPTEAVQGGAGRLWSALVGPGSGATAPVYDMAVELNPWLLGRVLQPDGGSAPRVPWLAAFLAVYVLVVGPVNVLVLRRFGRRELAWVTVPLVSVVFTAASFAGAVGQRPPVGVGASLAYWVDGVGSEVTVAGTRAPTPGARRIDLDGSDWVVRPVGESTNGAQVRRGAATSVGLDLPAMTLGAVIASRTTAAPAPLEVRAVTGVDGVEVTVTNVGRQPVAGVTVRAATAQRRVGDLAPGATAAVRLGGGLLDELPQWGDPMADIIPGPGGLVTLPRSLQALLHARVMDGNPGLVWALGSVADVPVTVSVEGTAPAATGALVAVAVQPEATSAVTPFAVARDLVAADRDAYRPHPLVVEGPGAAVLRFRLPAGVPLERLHADLERPNRFGGGPIELTVWDVDAAAWLPLGDVFGAGGGQGADPARVVSAMGEVYVRAAGQLFPFDFAGRSVSGVPTGAHR